ncbi:MAG TPA: nitronate monooxygenase [Dehalococcoidia bacterium]|nr:nitronate monooxygenase [Dehalococcoidia bacterium]
MALSLHTKLCDMLDIEYPIMAFSHCRDVVAAVSNAGGCGVLGTVWLSPEEITAEVKWLKANTDKPFAIDVAFRTANQEIDTVERLLTKVPQEYKDFMDGIKKDLGLPEEIPGTRLERPYIGPEGAYESVKRQWEAAIKEKPAVFAAALGVTREAIEEAHAAGIKVISLVGNVKNARRVAELGVDIIVAQGTEAGGHTGRIGTMALVPQIVDAVSPIPVLAAGGIGDGRGLVAALALGAVGVWTGTIWLPVHESPLADWIKDRMLEAADEDAVITRVYTGKTARGLRNKYIDLWTQPGALPTLPMPLQGIYHPMPWSVYTEDPTSLAIFNTPQLREWVSTASGNIVGLINGRKSARQVLYDMVTQAVDILGTE